MMVRYAKDHAGDCYRMFNPVTNGIHETRDVIWLHRMYFPPTIPVPEPGIMPVVDLPALPVGERQYENGDAPEEEDQNKAQEGAPNKAQEGAPATKVTRFGRTVKPITRIEVNPKGKTYDMAGQATTADKAIPGAADGSEVQDLTNAEVAFYAAVGAMECHKNMEISCVGLGRLEGFLDTNELHTMKYDEAMATEEAEAWHDAVDDEHERMIKSKVFEARPKSEVPKGSKILLSTWSMKKKPNGTHRARLVARGFEQVDGSHQVR